MGEREWLSLASYPRDPRYPRLICFWWGTRRLESRRYMYRRFLTGAGCGLPDRIVSVTSTTKTPRMERMAEREWLSLVSYPRDPRYPRFKQGTPASLFSSASPRLRVIDLD